MNNSIKKVAYKLGINKAIIFTSSTSITGAIGSIITVILIVKYFTGLEQGFYYTFGSIVAIQIFFELGLNGIITQYVAHEASFLTWENDYTLSGESKYKSRLASLLHFSVKWYFSFALVLLVALIIIGGVFFNKYDTSGGTVSWKIPWLLLAIGTAFNLIISPLMAFLQGLGKVKEIAKLQFFMQFFRLSLVWVGLILGAKLFILGVSSIMIVSILSITLFIKYKPLFINLWTIKIVEKVHYRQEIFPYQWKIALSWISGYFIFQLFNPVLFATEGAVVAGQMGMTLAALNGISSLTMAWITTKVPLFSGLIAQQEYEKLDNIFNRTLKQSTAINLGALCSMAAVIYLIRTFNIEIGGKLLGNRFLAFIPMSLMMIPLFLNQFVFGWAVYLRCHKKEPFLINSIIGGILCSLSTVLLGKYFGVIGITAGYCSLCLLMLPWSYTIYKTKKAEWHRYQPSVF